MSFVSYIVNLPCRRNLIPLLFLHLNVFLEFLALRAKGSGRISYLAGSSSSSCSGWLASSRWRSVAVREEFKQEPRSGYLISIVVYRRLVLKAFVDHLSEHCLYYPIPRCWVIKRSKYLTKSIPWVPTGQGSGDGLEDEIIIKTIESSSIHDHRVTIALASYISVRDVGPRHDAVFCDAGDVTYVRECVESLGLSLDRSTSYAL